MKTEFNIIIVMALLVSAVLILVSQNPNETPKLLSFEKYSNDIVEINEKSKKYKLVDDEIKFNATKKLMQEKIKKISLDFMGLKISNVELLDGYYPFQDPHSVVERFDLEELSVCSFEQKIPLHLQTISQTENFQMFTKKYSSYKLELTIMDERSYLSNVHYGLIAFNHENQFASTYFHVDSCTDEITDKEPYHLNCFDGNDDYSYSTFNTDDILSSFSSVEFCKIKLDSWRQSLYDYSKTLQEKQRQLEMKLIASEDQVAFGPPFSEMNILGDLRNIVANMVHGKFDDQSTHEMIKKYEKQNGSLPKELLELIENRE